MNRRVFAVGILCLLAAGADSARAESRSPGRQPGGGSSRRVDRLAAAVEEGDVVWTSDDSSIPSAVAPPSREPSPFQLVQATEPAADVGRNNQGAPTVDAQQSSEGNDVGALGSAKLGTTESSISAGPAEELGAATLRAQHDAATLLRDVPGITVEPHAPNVNENTLRGRRLGQVPAKGSYWFPARQDLDTLLSKIDSTMVDKIVAYKGPYSSLYGPGFAFYNVELLRAPLYSEGTPFQSHSTSILQYQTNGEQWNGRQAIWGGDDVWGYRGGYSQRGGSDYETGNGTRLPSSYKSRQADVSLGGRITPDSTLNFQYIRLDQTDLEFPGQYFDINALVTDGYEGTYTLEDQGAFDLLTVDAWYNRTNFYGDNLNPSKRALLPVDRTQDVPDGQNGGFTRFRTTLNSFTNVMNHSAGFRSAFSWGDPTDEQLTAGADLRYLGQRIDENNNLIVTTQQYDNNGQPRGPEMPFLNQTFSNPLPKGYSANPGVFAEYRRPISDELRIRSGARADWVNMDAAEFVPGVNGSLATALGGPFDQSFNLGSAFTTVDYFLTDVYSVNAGGAFAMNPPTMTQMYAFGPFIAVLPQYIFTSVFGDPNLRPEQMGQVDAGMSADYGYARSGFSVYHAWVKDYITLDFLDTGGSSAYAFVNTPLATLAGCEAYGECDIVPTVTAFGTMFYVEGRDHGRNETISAQRKVLNPNAKNDERSASVFGPPGTIVNEAKEPLPVIAPLGSRIGLRLHPAQTIPAWNVEFAANVVDNQDRVATSLREFKTPGYTTYDIFTYWQASPHQMLTAGVRNLTDKYYQTYFDTRQAGTAPVTQVFQPGISFFFGWEYTM